MADDIKNTIYVGNKPPVVYAASIQTQVTKGEKEIHIKARGRTISKAVDISQLVVNRFLTGWQISNVTLGTDEMEIQATKEDEKTKIKVSTIDITLVAQ